LMPRSIGRAARPLSFSAKIILSAIGIMILKDVLLRPKRENSSETVKRATQV
jgi:hypothetical protein